MKTMLLSSPLGALRLTVHDGAVTGLDWVVPTAQGADATRPNAVDGGALPNAIGGDGPLPTVDFAAVGAAYVAHDGDGGSDGPHACSVPVPAAPNGATAAARACGVGEIAHRDAVAQSPGQGQDDALLTAAAAQLAAYFAGQRQGFDLPVRLQGTPFQRAVWQVLTTIPYGETRTYGQVAAAAGYPTAFRAVGMACHRNPVAILVPCHRVVGAAGLGGYNGGVCFKQGLLRLEGVH